MLLSAQEIVFTIKTLRYDFNVSDVPKLKYRVRLRTCISEITWGALIGVGALITSNTVFYYITVRCNGVFITRTGHVIMKIHFPFHRVTLSETLNSQKKQFTIVVCKWMT